MKIGILECGHTVPDIEAKYGTFPTMFAALLEGHDFSFASYDVEHLVFPDSPSDCDGWLLTGSKHGAYEDHPFIPPLEAFIRESYAGEVPLVGICFGHQIIAQALGGHVEKFEEGWAVGRTEYAFDGLGQLHLNAWHQDQVLRLPKDAKVVGSNPFCRNAALAYGNKAWTLQPHPEFGGQIIGDYAAMRKGTGDYPDAGMDYARDTAHLPNDNATISTASA